MIQLTQGYSIRLANPNDFWGLIKLIQTGVEELRPFEEFDQDHLYNTLQEILKKPLTEVCLIVLEHKEDLVGCISGQRTYGHFAKQFLAVESHYFVESEHRGVQSLKLLEAFEEWSRRVGCSEVYLSSGNDPRFGKLLKRKGYNEDKIIYKKVL